MVLALATGIAAGEFIYRSVRCRDAIGRLCGRGRLLALVQQSGTYEFDLKRKIEANFEVAGIKAGDPIHALDPKSKGELLLQLVADERLRKVSENESVSEAEIGRAVNLLRFQFANESIWLRRLRESGLSPGFVGTELRDDLCARRWIERQIANAIETDDESCHQFYAAHHEDFAQPLRLRASHLFLAAPPESPPEVVAAKRTMIDSLAARIANGEEFSWLAAEASEDEATKLRGGDLGYFSEWRMPDEFFAAVAKLPVDGISKPIRSHLGFHLVRITEVKPAREMTYEEARPEIICLLGNQLRQAAVQLLTRQMAERGR